MDALASLLDGPRARGAFLLRVVMDPPFCIRVEDHAPLSLMAVTESRLALAADLLCDPTATVAGVARKVGYGSGFALSAAFSRERGVSPTEYRTRAAALAAVEPA